MYIQIYILVQGSSSHSNKLQASTRQYLFATFKGLWSINTLQVDAIGKYKKNNSGKVSVYPIYSQVIGICEMITLRQS